MEQFRKREKKGEYYLRLFEAVVIFLFGIVVVATSLPSNGYGVVVGLELMGGGILLGQNKFEGFRMPGK